MLNILLQAKKYKMELFFSSSGLWPLLLVLVTSKAMRLRILICRFRGTGQNKGGTLGVVVAGRDGAQGLRGSLKHFFSEGELRGL